MNTTTKPQHLASLDKANEIRLGRARAKADLRAGKIGMADALEHEAMQSATVYDVLTTMPRWGRARTRRLLVGLEIGEHRYVRDLTERQKTAIVVATSRRS